MSRNESGNGYTVAPVAEPGQASANVQTPVNIPIEFMRLPQPGTRCPLTGLSRSYLNGLILPTEANGHKPPVRSCCLRQRGAKKGVRLISYDSLMAWLRSHLEPIGAETPAAGQTQTNEGAPN